MQRDTRSAAEGRWRGILPALGIDPKVLDGKHHPCPACGGRDRFRFDNHYAQPGDGGFYCSRCGPGDGFTLLRRVKNQSFAEVARAVDEILGTNPPPAEATPYRRTDPAEARRKLGRALQSARPSHHREATQLRAYLTHRGLPQTVLNGVTDLLYAREVWGAGMNAPTPAMLGLIRDARGRLVSIHKTFLHGNRKAGIKSPKQIASPTTTIRGAAVRLYRAGSTLAVTEGIETALAVRALTGLPTWACLSAGGLAAFEIPTGVTHLRIHADHDRNGIGQTAAAELYGRAWREGVSASIHLPDKPGDWLDALTSRQAEEAAA